MAEVYCGYGFKLGSDNFKKRTIKEKYHYEIRYNEKTGKPYKNKVKIIDAYAGVEWFFGDWISLDYLFDDYICENRYGKKYFPPKYDCICFI